MISKTHFELQTPIITVSLGSDVQPAQSNTRVYFVLGHGRRYLNKVVLDLKICADYFALSGRSCENFNFPTHLSWERSLKDVYIFI